jgi:phosphinothricin acetyltransferase
MHLRLAKEADAAALLEIYRPYVEHTAISFEEDVPRVGAFRDRIVSTLETYPYLVCETTEEKIVGYAYASRHRERAAYRWSADLSVYLDSACHGRGIGKALYRALIEILRLQRVRTVYGGVTSPNPASEALHESLGFRRVGAFENVGYKHGSWHSVIWFEKAILSYDKTPGEPISIENLKKEAIASILEKAFDQK